MKQMPTITACLITLITHAVIAAPALTDVRSHLQQLTERCIRPVIDTGEEHTHGRIVPTFKEGKCVIISPDGTALKADLPGLKLFGKSMNKDVFISKKLEVKLADGRTIEYRLHASNSPLHLSIIKPVVPLSDEPYIDISQLPHLPLGMQVYSMLKDFNHADYDVTLRSVISAPGKSEDKYFDPALMLFSTLTGRFVGWNTYLIGGDADAWVPTQQALRFIEANSAIRFNTTDLSHEAVNPAYQRVYAKNKRSVGTLLISSKGSSTSTSDYYILTPSGEMLTDIPFPMTGDDTIVRNVSATAILPDGTKCPMKWVLVDRIVGIAILTPIKPLKSRMIPVEWANGSPSFFGTDLYEYSASSSTVRPVNIAGHDANHPDRVVTDAVMLTLLFDADGRAVALKSSSKGMNASAHVMIGADESVRFLKWKQPAMKLRQSTQRRPSMARSPLLKILNNKPRWLLIHTNPKNPMVQSVYPANCIDQDGYFVIPSARNVLGDLIAPSKADDSTTEQVRSALADKKGIAQLYDGQKKIGDVKIVFQSPKLGFAIAKLMKPLLAPMRAITLTKCLPPSLDETIYGEDVESWDDRLLPFLNKHELLRSAQAPFCGMIDNQGDDGSLCYSADGQPRGYITSVLCFLTWPRSRRSCSSLKMPWRIGRGDRRSPYVKRALHTVGRSPIAPTTPGIP